jgi:hypothetical protein
VQSNSDKDCSKVSVEELKNRSWRQSDLVVLVNTKDQENNRLDRQCYQNTKLIAICTRLHFVPSMFDQRC